MGKTLGYGEITVANMTEPFTVMLTNEAQQFATDSNRKVTSAQSYYTDIIVIRGSQERTDYTIGNITSGSGITVSKTNERVTFSVSVGATIGADTGVIEIPITLDGQTVKKQFSWSCGKQGPQGVKGNDGNSFAWNMLSETNCGKKHWGTESSGGKYSVEDFITEDNIDAVKLICTEAISTSNWVYVLFKDIKMLKQLKPSTKYTLSYDIKANRSGAISHSICKGDVSNFCTNTVVVNNIIGNETWQHISVVLTTNDLKTTPTNEILYLSRNALSKVGYSIIKNLKLVEGDIDTPWSPSQSDIEGKGVVETVQYYLATSQASGVTSSTSGWSTDITSQKLTADKKYLWNCYQTKYSDGTSEPISTPKVIGVYGDKGQKGDSGEDGQDGAGFHWNLLSGTKDFDKTKMSIAGATSFDSQKYLGSTVIKAVSPTSGYIDPVAWNSTITPTPNTQYTISFYAKASVETLANSYFYPNCTIKCISNHQTTTAPDGAVSTMLSTEWERYSVTWTTSGSVSGTKSIIPVRLQHGISVDGATVYLCGVKLEQSDKPSPWCTTYEETLAKNLSITPSSQYFKSTDGGKTFAPNTITIKPTIQGEINFGKWQYSIDGGVSFADVVSGQKGLTISNNVLSISKDSSLYSDAVTMVTFRAVANDSSFYDTCSIAKIYDVSDIGDGRNLLTGVSSYTKDAPFEKTDSRADGWIVYQNIITSIELEAGKKYVLQAKTDGNWTANHDTNGQDPSKKLVTLWLCSDTTNDFFDMRQGYVVFTPTVTAKYKLRVNQYSNGTDAYTIHLWDIKLEKGSSPTGWTPAPEDVQTAILSTKSEISDVSLKVDNNKQAIEQRVEKTTYEQDLTLVKGDIGKANEGLNKWRYEIYPKSLFTNKPEDQRKISLDVFARNKNIIPTQSILLDDTKLGYSNYDDNYIGYAVTFVKMSEATKLETTFVHDDAGSFYLNGKLICTNGNNNFYSSATPDTVSCTLVKGWNCLEVVINEGTGSEGFKFGTVLSQLSTCQLMNCYYAMVTGRESQITNTLVQNTIDIEGVGTKVSKVTSVIGDNGENFTSFKNDYSDFKQTMNGFKTTVGQTYVTKDDFNGLEIGGVNLFVKSTASRGWWISNTGVLNADGGWGYSDYIDVSGMKNYIASGFTNLGISPATCFYDSNKAFVSGVQSENQNSQNSKRRTLPIPSNAKYMRFSFALADIDTLKIEQGTKATAYSPAPEDDEINGQNLVSNLPSNWEQGTVTEGSTTGTTYANTKSSSAGSVRPKELIPVSGNITISTAYSNQSKKPIRHWIAAYDINKNYLGNNYVSNAWNSFPRTLNMKDAKYIAIMVGYTDSSAITPSDISQICLKIERGTSATPFTLAPEDVNGKIVNVETIANQTAKKFEWIVKGGDSSSNFTLTDRVADLVAERINFNGLVTFSGLSTDAKNEIGKVAQSKVDGLEVGGRNLALQSKDFTSGEQYWSINSNFTRSVDSDGFTVLSIKRSGAGLEWNRAIPHNYIPVEEMHRGIIVSFDFMCDKVSELDRGCICALQIFNSGGGRIGWYESQDILSGAQCKLSAPLSDGKWIRVQIPFSEGNLKATYGNSDAVAYTSVSFNLVANGSIHFKKIKIEYGNKATDWTPAPEDVSQDATNKASQALTDAKNYSSSAVNWVTSNGSSTISLNSMVKKWTDGAVSDTTQINGGWIKANTITASKIALADFTNYSQLTRDTAATYGFAVTDDTDGTWFSTQGIRRDQFISETFPCNGGESYLIEYDISTNAKGANNSTDTKNYIGVAVGVYGYTGTVGSNGLPNKATNIWYADRITGSETSPSIHVKTTITTSTATKQFRVFLQSNGYYFEGTTKIRNLSVRRMYGGTLIVDGSITADKIATDAIKSRNYISSGGTQGSFLNLSDGSFTSPNLSWDSNGNLIATGGLIAGWTITNGKLYNGTSAGYAGIGKESVAWAFWAGASSPDDSANAPFRVGHDGSFKATNADITGTITATNGKIGRYDITSTYLMTNSGSNASGIGGNQAFWAGAEDSNSAPFRVGYDGVLWAENAAIRGSIETGNLGDEGDTVVIMNGRIGIQGTSNNVEIYSTGFKFGIDGDYYLESVSEGVKCYRNLYATDFIADGWIYNASGGHYTWKDRDDAYISCGDYNGHNVYYYANYHAFYVNKDSGQGMMYINTDGVTSRVGFTKTSDERIKKNFESFDDNIIDAYMNIEPVKYQLKQSSNDKYHFGFKAQHIDKVFSDYGDIYNESFDICTSRPIDPDKAKELYGVDGMVEEYGLRYDELIAPTTYMVQHTYKELESTKDELTKVKQEKADLETRLQAIEAKLGL